MVVKSVRIEDKTAEVVPKLIRVNGIVDKIKRLREMQARIRESRARIMESMRGQDICRCKLNVLRECKDGVKATQVEELDEVVREIRDSVAKIKEECLP